jgi:carbamate kinase
VRIVVALGGNVLLERGEAPDAEIQEHHVRVAARALAPLLSDHEVVITHGNGPQVGVLALESASDPALSRPYPFDTLVAETQGLIGNWLVGAIEHAAPDCEALCILTRTLVDAADPAFSEPTKFFGPIYAESEAVRFIRDRHWDMRQDGAEWRRVVASPEPVAIVELDEIRSLLTSGIIVICAGGGGIPVVREDGELRGVDAVVDKDLTTALLATRLHADMLLLLTDVANVQADYGKSTAHPIGHTTVAALRGQDFAAGSMGPKVEAACRFVEGTAATAAIGKLAEAPLLLAGKAGTIVSPGAHRAGGRSASLGRSQEVAP